MDTLRLVASVVLLLSCSSAVVAAAAPAPPSGGGDAHAMPCIQRLIPCQPYLHAPNPPPTCCVPLKEIVDNDVTCLCSVFNNADMLRSLNLTKANALDLPKACGANADVSRCKNAATPPTASPATPTTPMTPPASTNGSSSTGGSSNAATATVSFIGFNFVSVLFATIFF